MKTQNRSRDLTATLFALAAVLFSPALASAAPDLLVGTVGTNSVLRYDGSTGAFLGTFVASGSGGLAQPGGLLFGPDGHLYVSSAGTASVLRYHGLTGTFIDTFVTPGSGGLNNPLGLAFGPDGYLYVTSVFLNVPGRVFRYDGVTGAFINTFTPVDFSILFGAEGLISGPDGNLYVSDHSLDRIVRFDGTTGTFLGAFGVRIDEPRQMGFGPDGHLYISGFRGDTLHRLNGATGESINSVSVPGNGTCDLSISPCAGPYGLAFGPDGKLYISTFVTNKVLRFDVTPTSLTFLDEFVADDPTTVGVDESGGLATPKYLTFMPSVQTQIATLAEDVQQLVSVPRGTALTNTLDRATQSLDKGNNIAAVKQLGAFIMQVQSLIQGQLLPEADGQAFIDAAKAILNQIPK